ncbi:MAG: methyltransferase domain-containing protein [Candidatus Bathycorpusculaceae bacterium]
MADMISILIENRNVKSIADYGCGPATLLFTLAERFPKIEFYGFDVADSILQKNREKLQSLNWKTYISGRVNCQIRWRIENTI